jgi:flagellar motor switch protein FliM
MSESPNVPSPNVPASAAPPPGGQSDEDLAAAWGAETEGGDADGGDAAADGEAAQPARVLNQAEIDSLLGFDDGPATGENRSGIQRIISSGLVSYERLPMLEIVFDRLVRIMSTSLRNFTSDNVEVGIDNILSLRFGDYLNSIPLPAMLAVFKAEEWDNYGLMVIDSAMIYSIVDVLLGGRRGTAAMRIEGRPYTTIERTLVERLIHVVLADLSASFDPLCPVTFRFERLEVNPRFATISRLSNAAVLARLRMDMEDRGGRMELVLPYATLEPVRELLLQQFMGEKFGRDSIWETHLAEELWNTEIELDAVLDEQTMRLSDIIALKPGSRILLSAGLDAPIRLRCGTVSLFEGKVGRRKNHVAVRIERELVRNQAMER